MKGKIMAKSVVKKVQYVVLTEGRKKIKNAKKENNLT
jgi:hypothetical protein